MEWWTSKQNQRWGSLLAKQCYCSKFWWWEKYYWIYSIKWRYYGQQTIEKLSQTDKLTQLHNRVKLDQTLTSEYERFCRYKIPFSIIIIDIDYFKSVNDTYGQNVGDSVLVEISQILSSHCRTTDVIGRWGGEEFLIISTETPLEGAITLASKLREEIDNFEFKVVKHKTISLGVSQIQEGESIDSLITRADKHLYEAKNNGRNQVVTD